MSGPTWEVRTDEDGVLDEVVCVKPATVHLERMDKCAWWLGITFEDGTEIHVNVGAVRQGTVKSFATYWVDDSDPEGPLTNEGDPPQ